MNDEIKEIIIFIENKIYPKDSLLFEKWSFFKDYITNLQQRCEYLERSNNRREDTILGLRQEIYEQEDYKSRCEKASEYIKSEKEHYLTKGCLIADTNNANLIVSAAVNTCDCSLNILQNGSEKDG